MPSHQPGRFTDSIVKTADARKRVFASEAKQSSCAPAGAQNNVRWLLKCCAFCLARCARTGLPRRRCAPPRNDAERNARFGTGSIVKQPPASLFELRRPRRASELQSRVIAPVPLRLRAAGPFLLSSSPEGACGTPGVSPRPRRQVCRHATGTPGALCLQHRAAAARESKRRGHLSFSPQKGSPPRKQVLRLRSARDGLCGLLHVPGAPFRRRVPVRASYCPDMHLGRPPVCRSFPPVRLAETGHSEVRHRSGHRIPPHATKTLATRPLPERDAQVIVLGKNSVKRCMKIIQKIDVHGL